MYAHYKTQTKAPVRYSADVFGLIAWLETQPGKTSYNYADDEDCLLRRFSLASDFDYTPRLLTWDDLENLDRGKPEGISDAEILEWVALSARTYSEALVCARAIASVQP